QFHLTRWVYYLHAHILRVRGPELETDVVLSNFMRAHLVIGSGRIADLFGIFIQVEFKIPLAHHCPLPFTGRAVGDYAPFPVVWLAVIEQVESHRPFPIPDW